MIKPEESFGLIFLLLSATLTAHMATKKGFSWKLWFFWGILIGPIAGLFLYCRTPHHTRVEKKTSLKAVPGLWFYLDEKHEQTGPVSSYKIQEMLIKNLLSKDSYIWSEGMQEWKKIQNTPFKSLLLD